MCGVKIQMPDHAIPATAIRCWAAGTRAGCHRTSRARGCRGEAPLRGHERGGAVRHHLSGPREADPCGGRAPGALRRVVRHIADGGLVWRRYNDVRRFTNMISARASYADQVAAHYKAPCVIGFQLAPRSCSKLLKYGHGMGYIEKPFREIKMSIEWNAPPQPPRLNDRPSATLRRLEGPVTLLEIG
jgi:hypothetical protein